MRNFESPWCPLSEQAQTDFTDAAREAVSSVVGGFVAGVTSLVLGKEAQRAGIGATLATRSVLIVTSSDRAVAESIVTLPVLAHEAVAVDSEIRYIQAE